MCADVPSGKPICATPGCGEPAPNSTIGPLCERDLTAALVAVIALGPDLDVALARQAVFGDRSHSAGHAAPLPYDPRVAEVADQLRGVLSGWVRVVAEVG